MVQAPIHEVSFAHTFDDAAAVSRRHTQYFEMFGHRAIDHDGWRAVCPWPGPPFAEAGKPFGVPITAEALTELDAQHRTSPRARVPRGGRSCTSTAGWPGRPGFRSPLPLR
ncbi:MAG TPA: hypothetical protein VMV92_29230 [Streptosporangiaceae bacterium]|nr:hypothetical protein [Streptosporangiaceae bacterium]